VVDCHHAFLLDSLLQYVWGIVDGDAGVAQACDVGGDEHKRVTHESWFANSALYLKSAFGEGAECYVHMAFGEGATQCTTAYAHLACITVHAYYCVSLHIVVILEILDMQGNANAYTTFSYTCRVTQANAHIKEEVREDLYIQAGLQVSYCIMMEWDELI
jgi:hypothetical protein